MISPADEERRLILSAMLKAIEEGDLDGYAQGYDDIRQLEIDTGEFDERACRVCGCTEANACEGGCSWVGPDLCSRCAEVLVDAGILEIVQEGGGRGAQAAADPDLDRHQGAGCAPPGAPPPADRDSGPGE